VRLQIERKTTRDIDGRRQVQQCRQGADTELSHKSGSMRFHRAPTDSQRRPDHFVAAPVEDVFEDHALARSQRIEQLIEGARAFAPCTIEEIPMQSVLHALKQLLRTARVLEEVEGTRSHDSHHQGNVPVRGKEDDRNSDVALNKMVQ
jgi:hypothetical protein